MELKITRWQNPEPLSEAEVRETFFREGLFPFDWTNLPGDFYPPHVHPFDTITYILRGSVTWILMDTGEEIEAHAGDRIELPRGLVHAARIGSQGSVCIEGHRD